MAKIFEAITTACETTAQIIKEYLDSKTATLANSINTARDELTRDVNAATDNVNQLAAGIEADLSQRDRVVNLLDNSWFVNPINQRGNTSVTTNWTYFIDRWIATAASETAPMTVSADGLTISNTAGASTTSLRQNIEKFPDGTYTAAAYANGMIYYQVFTVAGGGIIKGNKNFDGKGQIHLSMSDGKLLYNLQAFNGHDVTFRWAALYPGTYTADTLPEYQPKGYAVELMECMRYYQTFYRLYGESIGNVSRESIVLRPRMRVAPTVTKISGWEGSTGAGYAVQASGAGYIDIQYTGWGNVSLACSADL